MRGQNRQIWAGVYASEQAEQGKRLFESNCATCHRSDLSGDRGPALTGDRFFTSWQSGSVNRLYSKIKETMPPNRGSVGLTEDNFLSIVAYILESNAFPASKDDTLLTPDVLDDVVIARRDGGASSRLANFALVEVVGCLAGADGEWLLTHASQPVITGDQPATARAAGQPGEAARRRHLRAAQRRAFQAGQSTGTAAGGQGAGLQVAHRRADQPDIAPGRGLTTPGRAVRSSQ